MVSFGERNRPSGSAAEAKTKVRHPRKIFPSSAWRLIGFMRHLEWKLRMLEKDFIIYYACVI
jgi:hypothetical protein